MSPRKVTVLVVLAGFAIVAILSALLRAQPAIVMVAANLVVGIVTALAALGLAPSDAEMRARERDVARMGEENRHAAVLRERLRIARDLHDTLAHSMAAMLTQIRLIRKLATMAPQRVDEELESAEQTALDGLREARSAVTRMRYQAVRDDGLGAALGRLTKQLRLRKSIDIDLNVDARAFVLADERAETVYRIVEEAVHNIERHAGVERGVIVAKVKPDTANGCLEVVVRDEGNGFDPSVGAIGSYGLTGMREQVEMIGGTLLIESARQRGTQLTISLSL